MNRQHSAALSGWMVAAIVVPLLAAGCTGGGRPALIPNPDESLRKTSAQFAADAAKRTYPEDAQRAEAKDAPARAQVQYNPLNQLELVNLSDRDYLDVEVWVNKKYVIFVPKMTPNTLKRLDFKALYDREGNYFETSKEQPTINVVELYMGGKLYPVPTQLGD